MIYEIADGYHADGIGRPFRAVEVMEEMEGLRLVIARYIDNGKYIRVPAYSLRDPETKSYPFLD